MLLFEIIQIVITILALGFIFSGMIKSPKLESDPLEQYGYGKSRWHDLLNWENIKFAMMITAPAVILHELGHKFSAMGYGLEAVYHMSYFGLALGVILRLVGFGFIFFIPGYVAISGAATPLAHSVIAFAGPGINLALFLISWFILEKDYFPQHAKAFYLSKQINLWLFILNMLPIPGIDGYSVYTGLFQTFF